MLKLLSLNSKFVIILPAALQFLCTTIFSPSFYAGRSTFNEWKFKKKRCEN